MGNSHELDIQRLIAIGRQISKELARLAMEEEWEKLHMEWNRPGFTTPAEYMLIKSILDSMSVQAHALTTLKGDLLKACKAVSARGREVATG